MSTENAAKLAADTLAGDMVSFVIDRLRAMECGWRHMDEAMQAQMISEAKNAVFDFIERATATIADQGFDTIPAKVKKVVNTGDEIQVTLTALTTDEHRHELFDATGSKVRVVVADPEAFQGGDMPEADPDQPDMGLGGPRPDDSAA